MSKLRLSVGPHIHDSSSVKGIMLDVIIALLPATLAGCIIFGWSALAVIATCVGCCVSFEFLYNKIVHKKQSVGDLSAIVTGLLLALNLPANIPLWQAIVGSFFAIIVVKCIFGGMGCNLVNPAITARVFMIIAFGAMTTAAFPVDAVAGATPLADMANGNSVDTMTLLLGTHGGAIGETCAIALIIGGIYLLARRVITWHIPVVFVGTVFVFSFLVNGFDAALALNQLLSGGLLIGAFFMATDYVTSPATPAGKIVAGLFCGIITVMIRQWGNYPEGVSFAILLMNIIDPYIDVWTARKVFGLGGAKK